MTLSLWTNNLQLLGKETGKTKQRRFEANAHTSHRCLRCRHKQAQGLCHQSIALLFFYLPPHPTLPLHSFRLLRKEIKNNATVLRSNQSQYNNDELSCGEKSRPGWGCMADDKTRARWDSFTGLAARCLLRPLRIMQCGTVRFNQKGPPGKRGGMQDFAHTCPFHMYVGEDKKSFIYNKRERRMGL